LAAKAEAGGIRRIVDFSQPRAPVPARGVTDGSKHQWLGDQRWHDLIVILDDATSEIYYAQLVEEESTQTVMAGLRE